MGRPGRIPNSPPPKIRAARIERMKTGLSLASVSTRTGIPINYLSEFERGERTLDDADLVLLGRLYNYTDPPALAREAVVVPAEAWQE